MALRRCHKALPHRLRFEEMCSLTLRGDLPPQFDRDDHSRRFPGLIGDDLDVRVQHNFSLPPS